MRKIQADGNSVQNAGISVGGVTTANRVFLAPMSGVSDLPFRTAAHGGGAGLVVSEMVACEALARQRGDVVRRAEGVGLSPFVIQLAGREARWMALGARLAVDAGADIVDINMGCPARAVTGGLSGSALMRDLDHACRLIEATVAACAVPVTLKMRLGWDDGSRNAAELARRAEDLGVAMVTVHGRTRCQFYKGRADWDAIAAVKQAVSIPVIANGDIASFADVVTCLERSRCDGVMVGRAAYGRPWIVGVWARRLAGDNEAVEPGPGEQVAMTGAHYDHMIAFYGCNLGVRVARKHLGWFVERCAANGWLEASDVANWRCRLVREDEPERVRATLSAMAAAMAWRPARAA